MSFKCLLSFILHENFWSVDFCLILLTIDLHLSWYTMELLLYSCYSDQFHSSMAWRRHLYIRSESFPEEGWSFLLFFLTSSPPPHLPSVVSPVVIVIVRVSEPQIRNFNFCRLNMPQSLCYFSRVAPDRQKHSLIHEFNDSIFIDRRFPSILLDDLISSLDVNFKVLTHFIKFNRGQCHKLQWILFLSAIRRTRQMVMLRLWGLWLGLMKTIFTDGRAKVF